MMQIAMRIADNSGNTLDVPEYHRDHLGNNRMDVAATGGVHQITHYYPYGMPMDCGYIPAYQRWLFGDKEFDRTSGLDLYDFEARAYDPALGRFRQPDPLAEFAHNQTPFRYAFNNPLLYIDLHGLFESKEDAEAYARTLNTPSTPLQNRHTGEWFVPMNEAETDGYTTGSTVTQYYGPTIQNNNNLYFGFAGGFLSYRQFTQYSQFLCQWRGKDGVLRHNITGRGPNQYTGSRALAKSKANQIGIASNLLTGLNIYVTYNEYEQETKQKYGPNMRAYLKAKHNRDQFFNGLGFCKEIGAAASFGYSLGYLIEAIGQKILNNPDFRIRLNPYTLDFTPIEKTLQEYDNAGIIIY